MITAQRTAHCGILYKMYTDVLARQGLFLYLSYHNYELIITVFIHILFITLTQLMKKISEILTSAAEHDSVSFCLILIGHTFEKRPEDEKSIIWHNVRHLFILEDTYIRKWIATETVD